MSVSEQGLLEAQWLYELHRQGRGRRPSPPAPGPVAPPRPYAEGRAALTRDAAPTRVA